MISKQIIFIIEIVLQISRPVAQYYRSQTVDKAPSCEGALSTVCLFIVIFTVIFSFPNHASYFL